MNTKKEKTNNQIIRREDTRGDYKEVRCPKGCDRVLFEFANDSLDTSHLWVKCEKCERMLLPHKWFQSEGESHLLTYVYECKNCSCCYEKDFEAVRARCKGCRKFQNVFTPGRFLRIVAFPSQADQAA